MNEQKQSAASLKADYERLAKATTAAYSAVAKTKAPVAVNNERDARLKEAEATKAAKGKAFAAWKQAEAEEAKAKSVKA